MFRFVIPPYGTRTEVLNCTLLSTKTFFIHFSLFFVFWGEISCKPPGWIIIVFFAGRCVFSICNKSTFENAFMFLPFYLQKSLGQCLATRTRSSAYCFVPRTGVPLYITQGKQEKGTHRRKQTFPSPGTHKGRVSGSGERGRRRGGGGVPSVK